jgi:flavin-dependent dehydrogenase
MYDAIVVGARVAGASTVVLLARKGLDVLLVDRAGFPSDTLSTHQVQVPGVAALKRWGVLERIQAAGTPATRRVRFDTGSIVLEGCFPEYEGVDALYSPRRRMLDAILLEAAREAGAEVRERFPVDEILFEDGRAAGVRSGAVRETARIVIGADGRHSAVAKAVRAPAYKVKPPLTIGYYTTGRACRCIERAALHDWVMTALERLSEPLRVAVMLRNFSGASSYAAIADLCGVQAPALRRSQSVAAAR